MAQHQTFTLSELIKSVSEELQKARAEPDKAIIQLEKCELELAVSVKGEAKGGIKFWIVDAGAKVSGETISKIKVSFAPVAGKPAAAYQAIPKQQTTPTQLGEPHGAKVKNP